MPNGGRENSEISIGNSSLVSFFSSFFLDLLNSPHFFNKGTHTHIFT